MEGRGGYTDPLYDITLYIIHNTYSKNGHIYDFTKITRRGNRRLVPKMTNKSPSTTSGFNLGSSNKRGNLLYGNMQGKAYSTYFLRKQ